MADKINIDLSGLAEYAPVEGFGSSSLLKQDGFFKCTITKLTTGQSKTSKNNKYTIGLTVLDEDEKGATLIGDVLLSGVDKNGKPNVRHLGDLLLSVGMGQEQIRALAAKGVIDAEALIPTLVGKMTHVEVQAETYEGNMTSRPRNYIAPQRYNDALAASTHRKPRRADMSFASQPGGVSTGPAVIGGTAAAKPNGAASAPSMGAVDPLASLASLNLNIG